jgi:hypothetical protein
LGSFNKLLFPVFPRKWGGFPFFHGANLMYSYLWKISPPIIFFCQKLSFDEINPEQIQRKILFEFRINRPANKAEEIKSTGIEMNMTHSLRLFSLFHLFWWLRKKRWFVILPSAERKLYSSQGLTGKIYIIFYYKFRRSSGSFFFVCWQVRP